MPSDKRARQKQNRQARQAQLREAQERRRKRRQLVPVAVVALAGVVLIVVLGISRSGGSKTSTRPGATTTAPAGTGGEPAGVSARPAPAAAGAACSASPPSSGTTATVPAKPPAVAVITAPAGVGFPALDGSAPHYTKFAAAPPFCIDTTKTYTATMVTDAGTITLKLDAKAAPVTVNNFVFLAGYHYFDGMIFHRVIPGFVDQGGDPTGTGSGGPGYSFADELPASNSAYTAGALAMANSGPNTNGSQFFIVVGTGGSGLQPNYTYYGQVTSGMDVATKINADGDQSGTPKVTHTIKSVSIAVS